MQSSEREAGGGRTPDDGNCLDQARIEHSAQIHKYTNTQIHKYTNTHIHKSTITQIHLMMVIGQIEPGMEHSAHSAIGNRRVGGGW